MDMKKTAIYIVQAAVIAAVYMILTYAIAPIASGLFQCRISEAMCVLPYFTSAGVPGLFVGCLLANFLMGALAPDILFGSLATLLSAIVTRFLAVRFPAKRARFLAPLPAVLFNAVIVGWLLAYVYEVGASFLVCALYVAAGQALACYAGGMPLMAMLDRYRARLFPV